MYCGFRQPAGTFTLYSWFNQWPKSTLLSPPQQTPSQSTSLICQFLTYEIQFTELTVNWGVPTSLPPVHAHSELNLAHNFQLRFILILFIPSQSSLHLPCVLSLKLFYESFISPLSATAITQSVDGLNIKGFIPNALLLCYYRLTLTQLPRVSFLAELLQYRLT